MGKEEKKIVAIRGIDRNLYEKIAAMAKSSGRTIGEMINEAMKVLIVTTYKVAEAGSQLAKNVLEERSHKGGEVEVISNLEELEVSKEDLEEVKKVSFKNIRVLKFLPDVPFELFQEKVVGIIMCDEIYIPKSFPKLKVAKKLKYCKKIKYVERSYGFRATKFKVLSKGSLTSANVERSE